MNNQTMPLLALDYHNDDVKISIEVYCLILFIRLHLFWDVWDEDQYYLQGLFVCMLVSDNITNVDLLTTVLHSVRASMFCQISIWTNSRKLGSVWVIVVRILKSVFSVLSLYCYLCTIPRHKRTSQTDDRPAEWGKLFVNMSIYISASMANIPVILRLYQYMINTSYKMILTPFSSVGWIRFRRILQKLCAS